MSGVRIPRASWALMLAHLAGVPVVEGRPFSVSEREFRTNEQTWWDGFVLHVGPHWKPEDLLHEVGHAITAGDGNKRLANWGLADMSESEQRDAEALADCAANALELGLRAATKLISGGAE